MINEGGVASQTLYVVTHSHSDTHNFGDLYINRTFFDGCVAILAKIRR